ncbi:MAG: VCBS repeat-containing protein, partial [Bacteroidota bacterium]|nr:VCBS repeat-containing protein [Bacteroidota bacterium]
MRLTSLLVLASMLLSCSDAKKKEESEDASVSAPQVKEEVPASGLTGKELSEAYCSSCHAYVNPKELPKAIWIEDVLPEMGNRLGIYKSGSRPDNLFDAGVSGAIVRKANIYPESPLLAEEDWNKIVQYFRDHAPDSIPPPLRKHKLRTDLRLFKYKEAPRSGRPAFTTMVKALPGNRGIAYGHSLGNRNTLTFLNPTLQENYSLSLQSAPVQFYEKSNELYLTTIGRKIFPSDAPDGALHRLERNWPEPKYKPGTVILPDLQRPVCMAFGDLNNDGHEDIAICEFGNNTGWLSWYENNGAGGYTKRVLRDKPGAVTAIIRDANNDGLPDIYVLMAQGEEGIFLYENQGSGKFQEKPLLSFSPLNGSQYMELADFNNDGHDDILYVCGDNADKSPILKKYHGIYIFLNDAGAGFKQRYFYPMNGAYKAMARDYDRDGDLDIAAISFFPDYIRYPEESFVYLRNTGNLKFEDYSFPESSKGRWMVMDAGDIDGDDDIDLVLGSFVYFLPDGDTTG